MLCTFEKSVLAALASAQRCFSWFSQLKMKFYVALFVQYF
jgi:hypothetical protein